MKRVQYLLTVIALACVVVISVKNYFIVDFSPNDMSVDLDTDASVKEDSAFENMPAVNSVSDSSSEFRKAPADQASLNTILNDPAFKDRLAVMRNRRKHRDFDPNEVARAMSRKQTWTLNNPDDDVPETLPLKAEEFTDGRQFLQFDELKLETLIPGDQFSVQVDQSGHEHAVQIDSVIVHDDKRISWYGHLTGLDKIYNVSFTRGESLTVGGFSTPEGHYVLQAHGDKGWVASSRLLYKFDPGRSDLAEANDDL